MNLFLLTWSWWKIGYFCLFCFVSTEIHCDLYYILHFHIFSIATLQMQIMLKQKCSVLNPFAPMDFHLCCKKNCTFFAILDKFVYFAIIYVVLTNLSSGCKSYLDIQFIFLFIWNLKTISLHHMCLYSTKYWY